MTEEETTSVEDQSSPAVAEAPESEATSSTQGATEQPSRKRNDEAYNWAEANRKMKEMQEQNRQLADRLQKVEKPAMPASESDDLDKLGDDDIVTKSQVKRLATKMAREIAQDVVKQRDAATVDDRLQMKFPDFADVVTRDAIEELKQAEPELAYSLSSNPDPYAQGVAAYKLLKRMGGGSDMAKSTEKKKAQENSQKPVSVNAVSKHSAIGNAHLFENGLTPELKKQLWKEMEDARKRM